MRLAQVSSYEFYKISKKTFFTEHLRATASDPVTEDDLQKVVANAKNVNILANK